MTQRRYPYTVRVMQSAPLIRYQEVRMEVPEVVTVRSPFEFRLFDVVAEGVWIGYLDSTGRYECFTNGPQRTETVDGQDFVVSVPRPFDMALVFPVIVLRASNRDGED